MQTPFQPTQTEIEALVRVHAMNRAELVLRRAEFGRATRDESEAIIEATQRLAAITVEIGDENVERIVAETEKKYRNTIGNVAWTILVDGTSKQCNAHTKNVDLSRCWGDGRPKSNWRRLTLSQHGVNWSGRLVAECPTMFVTKHYDEYFWRVADFAMDDSGEAGYRDLTGQSRTLWEAMQCAEDALIVLRSHH